MIYYNNQKEGMQVYVGYLPKSQNNWESIFSNLSQTIKRSPRTT